MRYVLLTWNPGPNNEAQYTPEQWLDEVVLPLQSGEPLNGLRWSIGTNWNVITEGDSVCMLRQGNYGRGIVATGVVTSSPYPAPHWDETKPGDAHYVKVSWARAMDLNHMITIDELEREVPDFPWSQVYSSGRIVEGDSAASLAVLLGHSSFSGGRAGKGQGLGKAEHNRLVEAEAMRLVTEGYQAEAWTVTDVSQENLGWDLEARRGQSVRRIEVKGVTGPDPSFFLTPNEYRAAASEPDWIAVVITEIFRDEPSWFELEADHVVANAAPTQYRVTG